MEKNLHRMYQIWTFSFLFSMIKIRKEKKGIPYLCYQVIWRRDQIFCVQAEGRWSGHLICGQEKESF